jgi:hypothetical protein
LTSAEAFESILGQRPTEEEKMTQILIVTDAAQGGGEVVYRERVDAVHLASEHSRRQLAERLAWGVGDAARTERQGRTSRAGRTRQVEELRVA